jgi:hypothetical protein
MRRAKQRWRLFALVARESMRVESEKKFLRAMHFDLDESAAIRKIYVQ